MRAYCRLRLSTDNLSLHLHWQQYLFIPLASFYYLELYIYEAFITRLCTRRTRRSTVRSRGEDAMVASETAIELVDEVRVRLVVRSLWDLNFTIQSQVSGENGEIYLFQWLSSTERLVKKATAVRRTVLYMQSTSHFPSRSSSRPYRSTLRQT